MAVEIIKTPEQKEVDKKLGILAHNQKIIMSTMTEWRRQLDILITNMTEVNAKLRGRDGEDRTV